MESPQLETRRTFLRHSLRCCGAAWLASSCDGPAWAADSPSKAKMRLGLVTYLWGRDWDLSTLIANCERSEVLGVELRTTHAHGVEPSLNAQQRQEVAKRFADSPVQMVGIGSNERFDHLQPEDLGKAVEATKAFIVLSHDVGGSGVKVKPNSFHQNVPREKTIEQIGTALNEVAKFGEDYGQEIRLEVHGQCSELPTIKAIMDVADHPNATVCWNSNREDLSGQGLKYNFDLVKNRFGATCHVRELDDKSYPYQQLINLLVGADYKGWILLEARGNPTDRVAALVQQRRLFEDMVRSAMAL